jgi:glyoxylase-like metal-dependent hydrolase (beta-lactamase superfamily II)
MELPPLLFPGVHQLPCNYKNRPLNLYLLQAGSESLLMDTGDASTPASQILPFFEKIGFDPKSLTYILLTHPDVDHVGGVHAMRQIAPNARFLCGTLDREQIETPEGLADIRGAAHYYWHDMGLSPDKRADFLKNAGGAGNRIEIARTFDGGESLQLGGDKGRTLHIMHLPGHSMGHLGVYIKEENAAIVGDAVHGTANRFFDGKAAFAPTYMYIDAYLGTIERLRAMNLERLYSCHWPNCETNAQVNTFLDASRVYALHAEGAILETVRAAGDKGITLKEICVVAKPRLGDWPAEKDGATANMACGHLQRLTALGLVRHDDNRPTRYYAETTWRGLR